MNATLLAALTDSERHLVAETEPAQLALLDEDQTAELHARVLRARNKYRGIYRRGASGKVAAKGSRGAARPASQRDRTRAEAFEVALGRVSARLASLARQEAKQLREDRLAAAASAKAGGSVAKSSPAKAKGRTVAAARSGDRSLRSPASEKKRASTQGANARWQGKRDDR
jgi:hypothetical protein